jgi:triosephosphate isomerase
MDPTRGILIAGNWKMNHGAKATVEFAAHFKSNWTFALAEKTRVALNGPSLGALIFPPFLSLETARHEFMGTPV